MDDRLHLGLGAARRAPLLAVHLGLDVFQARVAVLPGEERRRLERGGDVHVPHEDVLRQAQGDGGEVDEAAHAGAHQGLGGGLGELRRDSEYGHPDALLLDDLLEVRHGVHRTAFHGGADEGEVGVEPGGDAQKRPPPGEVGQHGTAQAAEAHQRHVLAGGAVEEVLDAGQAGVELVAAVGAARVADHHEVPAHLRGAHAGEVGELVRVDAGGARALQLGEQTAVPAEPLDRLPRDYWFC